MNNLIKCSMLVLFISLSFQAEAQKRNYKRSVKGSGNVITQERTIEKFDGISVNGVIDLVLMAGEEGTVKVEADDNLVGYIRTEVKGGMLSISTSGNIKNAKVLNVYLPFEDFDKMMVSGACSVMSKDMIKGNKLTLVGSGASDLNLKLDIKDFEGILSGATEIDIAGTAKNAKLSVSGAGDVDAYGFVTDQMNLSVSGAGSAEVKVEDELKIKVSGAGSVKYQGEAKVTATISGAGSAKRAKK